MLSAGHGLLNLIDEILDLSKIESGKMETEAQTVEVSALVDSLEGLFRVQAEQKNIALNIETLPEVPVTMVTDRLRLEQILRNLLSNAIKFTDKGAVEMKVSAGNDDMIVFAVSDSGIGIEPEKTKRHLRRISASRW